MKILGVTGNMGCGKSFVCGLLAKLGLPYYNSDFRAKQIVNTDHDVQKQIVALLGVKAYSEEGFFDRNHVSKIAMGDNTILGKIEDILKKPILEDLNMFKSQHIDKSAMCLESAILLNSDFRLHTDAILLVSADMPTKIKRLKERDPFRSDKEIDILYQNQLTEEDMIKVCQYEIHNVDKNEQVLLEELKIILKDLIIKKAD